LLEGALLGDVEVDGNLLDIKTFLLLLFSEAPTALSSWSHGSGIMK
jgi:hypothetical protein